MRISGLFGERRDCREEACAERALRVGNIWNIFDILWKSGMPSAVPGGNGEWRITGRVREIWRQRDGGTGVRPHSRNCTVSDRVTSRPLPPCLSPMRAQLPLAGSPFSPFCTPLSPLHPQIHCVPTLSPVSTLKLLGSEWDLPIARLHSLSQTIHQGLSLDFPLSLLERLDSGAFL